MENTKIEVALEIISMCIAIELNKGNTKEIVKLNKEKDMIYSGDKILIKKIIIEYGAKVKKELHGI